MPSTSKASRRQPEKATVATSTWESLLQQQPRKGLTRDGIIAAGIALADQYGLPAVSIRRIAAKLGSSPMALYRHVRTKRDLLNLIADAVNGEFEWPSASFPDWRSTLIHFARENRRSLKMHPWASALRNADLEYGPECIRTFERLLATLSGFGLDMRAATRALGVVMVFVNGFVAEETAVHAGKRASKDPRSTAAQPKFSRAVLATGKFPNVAKFVAMGAELPDDDGFERALNWILDGIGADLAAQTTPQRKKKAHT